MFYYSFCALMFVAAFSINMTYITVFYHRGLAHRAVHLKPWARRFVSATGIWMTGIDPKSWCCMHRRHHRYSDTALDPHSPTFVGLLGVMRAQLKSYEETQERLRRGDPEYAAEVVDLDFPVSWITRNNLWLLPYAAHLALAIGLGAATGAWLLATAYWVGMMSHPVQGWMVNAFAHRYGYRSFPTADNSRNNTLVAWLAMGEGYQNNHHRFPRAAKFSRGPKEVDLGYGLCLLTEVLGFITVRRSRRPALARKNWSLIPVRPAV